jgi:hypothetical protein
MKSDLGEDLGPFEMFFNGPFFNFLKKFGAIILGLYLCFTGAALATSALYLRTSKEATPFLRSNHPIQIFINHIDKFSTGADGEKDHVTLIFGLGNDKSSGEAFGPKKGSAPIDPVYGPAVGKYEMKDEDGDTVAIDPDDGESVPMPIFGGTGTLIEEDLQEQIWDKCEEGRDLDFVATQDTKDCEIETVDGVRVFKAPCRPGVTCFMQPLKEFIEHFGEDKLGYSWPPGKDLMDALESVAEFGIDEDDIEESPYAYINDPQKLSERHEENRSCDSEFIFRWKELEKMPKFKPGFQGKYGFLQKYIEYQKELGNGFYDLNGYFDFKRASGWYVEDKEVKAMWVRFNATIGNFQPMSYVEPIFNKWAEYTLEYDEGVPVHACPLWGWYITQKEMVLGVISSIISCAFLSWFVLACGTANWILATFAVFTIMSIIVQVMGSLVWMGYNPILKLGPGSLGIIETIGLSIAVGMSVDYTVHIVNAYNNCPMTDRVSRIRHSMTLMGISITLGMIATNISAFFLLLCVITFFTGFGQFIIMTIFYSWLSAFFILCPLLMLIGPEGRSGEITFLKKYIGGVSEEQPLHGKPDFDNKPIVNNAMLVNVSSNATQAITLDDNEAEI